MELNFNPNDRGQVGIGTLIVFIAMVLVAAIAAGVLINTAGFLQTQAEDTGTESTEQVANNLNVITETGIINDSGSGEGTVEQIEVGVQPAAGSDDLNLEELSLQYVADESFSNLVHVKSVSTNDDNEIVGEDTAFNTVPVTAEDGEDNVMTDNADRYDIVLPLEVGVEDFENAEDGDDGVFLNVTAGAGSDDTEIDNADDIDEVAVVEDLDQEDDDENDFEDINAVVEFDEDLDETALPTFTGDVDFDSNEADAIDQDFLEDLSNQNLEELVEGEDVELTYTTETGAQTTSILQVPDSLAGDDDGDAVDL